MEGGSREADYASEILDMDFRSSQSLVRSTRQARATSHSTADRALLRGLSRLVRGGGITIKGQRGLTTFGQGQREIEVRYLHAIVCRALMGSA